MTAALIRKVRGVHSRRSRGSRRARCRVATLQDEVYDDRDPQAGYDTADRLREVERRRAGSPADESCRRPEADTRVPSVRIEVQRLRIHSSTREDEMRDQKPAD